MFFRVKRNKNMEIQILAEGGGMKSISNYNILSSNVCRCNTLTTLAKKDAKVSKWTHSLQDFYILHESIRN